MTYTFKLARRLAVSRHLAMLPVLLLLTACSGDSTAPDPKPTSPNALAQFQVLPQAVTIETGQRVQFRTQTGDSTTELDPTTVAWEATGGTINSTGTFWASSPGTYRVIARRRWDAHLPVSPARHLSREQIDEWRAGRHGAALSVDTSIVKVVTLLPELRPQLERAVVRPARRRVTVGSTLQYRAYALTKTGDSVGIAVAFTATGGSISPSGLFTAGSKPGKYRVIARDSVSMLADTTRVTVALATTSATPTPSTPPATPPVSSVPPGRGAGLAAGLSSWPADSYCGRLNSGTMETLNPEVVLGRIQLAAKCGVRLVIVPPRRMLTTNALSKGVFSVDRAQRLTDRYAAVLPPDTLRKYRGTILGMNLGDDYTCSGCWGGRAITQAQVAAWAAYTRSRMPGLPLGVRTIPDWVAAYPALAPLLDYTWAQYHMGKGDARTYYDRAASVAGRLGLRVVMGINVEDCHGQGTAACAAGELVRLGTLAVNHPASCAFLNWRYEERTWQQAEVRAAWEELLAKARARPAQECRRVGE